MPKMVKMYNVGEEVLIKAKISEILVDNGEIKYHITAEHSNNPLDHKFTEHQMMPFCDKMDEEVEEGTDEFEDDGK